MADLLQEAQSIIGGVVDAASAVNDPDAYFFPKIAASTTKTDAVAWLDKWKSVKVLKYKTVGKSSADISGVGTMYNTLLNEINVRFGGATAPTGNSKIITVVIAIGVIALAFYMATKKGKKE